MHDVTPQARAWQQYLLHWQQQRCDEAVANIFGYYAVQVGVARFARFALQPHAPALAGGTRGGFDLRKPILPSARAGPTGLPPRSGPSSEASIDLPVLPHTLERCQSPHAAVREVARALVLRGGC